MLDDARNDVLAGDVAREALAESEPNAPGLDPDDVIDPEYAYAALTRFVAIATSHFVPDEGSELPESWVPYLSWGSMLSGNQTVVSFNHDRVVEKAVAGNGRLTNCTAAPTKDQLVEHLVKKSCVESICVPGSSKLAAARGALQ